MAIFLHFKSGYDGYDFVPGEKNYESGDFSRNSRAFDANKDFLKKFTHFWRESYTIWDTTEFTNPGIFFFVPGEKYFFEM